MDARTIATYDAVADVYDERTKIFWDIFPKTFLEEFVRTTGKKIVDVGSGPGRDGLLLQQYGKEVIGIDASQVMVDMSVSRGLSSVVGDFLHMPFEKESFDGVWAYTSLLHVSKNEIGAALNEIARVLVADGILGLGMIEGEGEMYRDNLTGERERWFSYYTKEELEKLLKEHNFKVLFFEKITPGSRNYLHVIAQKI